MFIFFDNQESSRRVEIVVGQSQLAVPAGEPQNGSRAFVLVPVLFSAHGPKARFRRYFSLACLRRCLVLNRPLFSGRFSLPAPQVKSQV
jgi:hypothetical protein